MLTWSQGRMLHTACNLHNSACVSLSVRMHLTCDRVCRSDTECDLLSSSVAVANQAVGWAKAVSGDTISRAAEQGNSLLHALSLLHDERSPFHIAKMQWAGAEAQAFCYPQCKVAVSADGTERALLRGALHRLLLLALACDSAEVCALCGRFTARWQYNVLIAAN